MAPDNTIYGATKRRCQPPKMIKRANELTNNISPKEMLNNALLLHQEHQEKYCIDPSSKTLIQMKHGNWNEIKTPQQRERLKMIQLKNAFNPSELYKTKAVSKSKLT
ncbi:hypothetical protein ElyMa_003098700 [Elysia marginata]|uniref:HMG box domain-containing protein n=1 Tax=Elysia marginata TaxID=1093978 RepID=A0AAV4IQH2_9GAST|nr:hypothetical protein ElyMa_003098700 [Elysia marginata]